MYNLLENLNVHLSENRKKKFDNYIQEFKSYNEKINLISKNDINFLFEKHIYDSLALNLFIQKYKIKEDAKCMDIGTGGGFPCVPLSILYDKMQFYGIDSIQKKINFIQGLGFENINTICSRIEDLPSDLKCGFDIVVTRALAELRIILEYASPFIKTGGYFAAYKSIKAQEELKNASNALKILNMKYTDKIEYELPIESQNSRCLLIFKKIKDIPSFYPRQNGLIKKKPL